MATSKSVIERIRALLAMGRGSANENEAAIAMKRAHALLTQHNLSQADVEGEDQRDAYENGVWESKYDLAWTRTVANAIAKLNFCKYYFMPKGRFNKTMGHHFVGRSVNVEVAKMVAEHVINTLRAESQRQAAGNHSFLSNFQLAASIRVHHRCEELIKQASTQDSEVDGSKVTALAVRNTYLAEQEGVNKWLVEKQGINLRQSKGGGTRGGKNRSAGGFAEGAAAGEKVALRPQARNTTKGYIE